MENIVEEFIKAHPKSSKLHERALKVFAADGATHYSRILFPFLPYITHAKGSRKWDIDGNEYIDYLMGHGALILGHGHPDVVKAVQAQAALGTHFSSNHELEIQWAELILEMIPWAEKVEFFSSGMEANMMALRLGRTYTGRNSVLKFEEHFHGWSDHLVEAGEPGVLPEDNLINTLAIPANDLNRLEQALATRKFAVLMTEGGGAHMGGQVPLDTTFVRAIPELVRRYGTVWCVDEVVTGFRDAPGGWQATVGVTPDLTTLGKCVAGGLGAGALVGKTDIMDALRPKNEKNRSIRHSGTWNANPLTAAAGVAACRLLKSGEVQKKVNELAAFILEKGNEVLEEKGILGRLYGRSIVHIYFGPAELDPSDKTLPPTWDMSKIIPISKSPMRKRLCLHLLQRGVAVGVSGGRFFIMSIAHSRRDIDETIKAFGDSLDAMVTEGSLAREYLK